MAVDKGHEIAPAVFLGEYMGHVDRPAAVHLGRYALHALRPGAIAIGTLPTLPALLLDDPVDFFPVDIGLPFPPEHCGNPPCPVFRKTFDDTPDGLDELRVRGSRFLLLRLGGVVHV